LYRESYGEVYKNPINNCMGNPIGNLAGDPIGIFVVNPVLYGILQGHSVENPISEFMGTTI
jgi:hypothetical protein